MVTGGSSHRVRQSALYDLLTNAHRDKDQENWPAGISLLFSCKLGCAWDFDWSFSGQRSFMILPSNIYHLEQLYCETDGLGGVRPDYIAFLVFTLPAYRDCK